MVTKAVWLSEEEASELTDFAQRIGEDEAVAPRVAALSGIRAYRLEKAFAAYRERSDSYEATAIAGLPRAVFLWEMGEHGRVMLQGPSTLVQDLRALVGRLSDERLAQAAQRLAEEDVER